MSAQLARDDAWEPTAEPESSEPLSEFLTQAEAAALLHVVPRSVWRFSRAGLLPSQGYGRHTRYRRIDVEKLREQRPPVPDIPFDDPDLVTTAEAAAILGCSRVAFSYRSKASGVHPVVSSIGRSGDLYRRADVLALTAWRPFARRRIVTIKREQRDVGALAETDLITTAEAASLLKVDRARNKFFVKTGKLVPAKRGRPPIGHRYLKSDVEALRPEVETWLRSQAEYAQRKAGRSPETTEFVTHAEACKLLGISRGTLRKRVEVGLITPIAKYGATTWYWRSDIEGLRQAKDSPAASPAVRTCGCNDECTAPILTPGLSYAQGHHGRTMGGRVLRGSVVGTRTKKPPNEFGIAVRRGWQKSGRNKGELCKWVGVVQQTLNDILSGRRLPLARTIAKFEAKLGKLPPIKTANEAARERAARTFLRTEDALAALALGDSEAGALSDEERAARLRRWFGTAEGHAYAWLRWRLNKFKREVGNRRPTTAEMAPWERACAKHLKAQGFDVSPGQVHRWFQTFMVKRGDRPPGGRTPDDELEAERCEIYSRLQNKWKWFGGSRTPTGLIADLMDEFVVSYDAAAKWRSRHHNRCSSGDHTAYET